MFDYDDDEHESESERWRNIKLCNDGYCYDTVPLSVYTIARHSNIYGWSNLTEFRHDLPRMMQYFEAHCGEDAIAEVWYNVKEKRTDVKCVGKHGFNIIVTFEPGYRCEEHLFPGGSVRVQN